MESISLQAVVNQKYTIQDSKQNVFTAKFSPDGRFIAVTYADGTIHIHNAQKGERLHSMHIGEGDEKKFMKPAIPGLSGLNASAHSVTGIAWKYRPLDTNHTAAIQSQSFKAVTSDGRIIEWKTESPDTFTTLYTSEENYYQCIDYSREYEGSCKLACAGDIPLIELFDETTMKRMQFFDLIDKIGHQNKIFSVKFDTVNPFVLYSGGWDRNIVIWDIRMGGKLAGQFFGPLLGGDSLDVDSSHNLLITGSQIQEDGIQMWDTRKLKLLRQAEWAQDKKDMSSIYSLTLMKPAKDLILACGANRNCAKIVSVATGAVLYDINSMSPKLEQSPLIAVDSSPLGRFGIIASADGHVYAKNILVAIDRHIDDDSDDD